MEAPDGGTSSSVSETLPDLHSLGCSSSYTRFSYRASYFICSPNNTFDSDWGNILSTVRVLGGKQAFILSLSRESQLGFLYSSQSSENDELDAALVRPACKPTAEVRRACRRCRELVTFIMDNEAETIHDGEWVRMKVCGYHAPGSATRSWGLALL